jgi:carbon monoxide dehydrogenase subunit G
MIKAENTISIMKPVEDVYAYTSDPNKTSEWQSGVESVEYPEGTPKVGTQFTEVRKFMGREMNTTLEITALEPNVKYAAKTLTGPISYEVIVTFEKEGEGTKMTTVIEGETGGFFKLAEGMVAKQLKKSVEESGQRLKSLLEGS